MTGKRKKGDVHPALKEYLMARSAAETWGAARKEWRLVGVHYDEDGAICPCGKNPIHEICTIRNDETGEAADIGNHCVLHFMDERPDLIAKDIRKLGGLDGRLSIRCVEFFHGIGVLNDRDLKFSIDTFDRYRLTPKQMAWRRDVNTKVVRHYLRRHLTAS